MYPSENTTLYGFLTGIAVLSVLLSIYVYSILRHQKRKMNTYRNLRNRDNVLLEAERKRIAADLHDGLGSMLATVRYGVENMGDLHPSSAAVKSLKHLDLSIGKIKEIAHNLVPQTLYRKGLAAAVGEFASEIRNMTNLKVVYDINIDEKGFGTDRQLNVFRIVQEIISNSLKHAKASEIIIRLTEGKENLLVEIGDNGIGFDPSVGGGSKRFGLDNILSRIEMLDARYEFFSEPGKGTSYRIKIPKTAMQ
jgi:two-component system NarL family sensor kinase